MAATTKPQPFNITHELKDTALLVRIALDGGSRPNKKGTAKLFGATPVPLRLAHPKLGLLTLMVKVAQPISTDPPEIAAMRVQQAELRAKLRAYREQRKTQKAAKK